jgi:hypothetical protein
MDIKLSAASISITPVQPVPLAGFAEREGVYTQVMDELEINLAAIKQEGKLVLLYSVDTLFVPDTFVTLIVDAFGKAYDIQEKNIWMAATHTHYAPSLDKEKPALGTVNDGYYKFVSEQLLQLTQKVLNSDFVNVHVQYGNGKSVLNVNRRKKLVRPRSKFSLYNKVLMYPDYAGVKDDDIHLVKFADDSGKVKMILWNYACHPVGYPHMHRVTAEYIGIIRQKLRDEYKDDNLPINFLIGFAGNMKPDLTPVTNTRWKDKLNYALQLGPKYVRFPDTASYLQWTELLWAELKIILDNVKSSVPSLVQATQHDVPLSDIIGDTGHKIHFKKLVLAEGFHFTGVSAEVLAEYKYLLERIEPSINVGCLAGTRIYLPTDKNVTEGGYEVHGFKNKFGISGHFKPGINDTVIKAISKL